MPSLKINHTIFRFVLVIRFAAVAVAALFWLDLWPSIFGNLLSTSMSFSSICFVWLTQSIASHFISHRISKMIINLAFE